MTRTLAVLTGRGVLVVRPDALEDLASATHVLFDKTGTLTEPWIARDRTVTLRDIDRDAALALAAALAQGSRHSLARAFTAAAPAALPPVNARESVAGRGIGGVIDGRRYRLGRADYALAREQQAPDLDDAVVLADDDGAIAAFHVDERPRPGTRAAVDALAARRSQRGDRERGREGKGRVGRRAPRYRDLGCAPGTRGQARMARVAARDRRARRRRRRRRERRPDARRLPTSPLPWARPPTWRRRRAIS